MAGFRALVQGLVQQAIQTIDDLADSISYRSVSAAAYDVTTGQTTNTSKTFTLNAPIARFTLTEADNSRLSAAAADSNVVVATDAKLIVAYLDLPVQPTNNDTLTSTNATTKQIKNWKVVKLIGSPGTAVWIIHIRET